MTKNTTVLWIEAGKILSHNNKANVTCPICAKSNLHTEDKRTIENPTILERRIYCPLCGAENYLRLVRPLLSNSRKSIDGSEEVN